MKILYIHNDYGQPSGEEYAAESIAQLLIENGHTVRWFRRSSAGLDRSKYGKMKAFVAGIYNPFSAVALKRILDSYRPDIVQVQNIYPLISPSIFGVLKRRSIPVVMRCPNYRLFCPNGLHMVKGQVCERCLSTGRELWCVLRNCEDSLLKSIGYALRGVVARILGSIVNNVDIFLVQSEFQKQKFVRNGIASDRIEILPGMIPAMRPPEHISLGDSVTFVGRISPEKGIEQFIEAANLLPDIPFIVAGDHRQMRGIRDRSPVNVRWLGFLNGDQLRDLYMKSRIVVIPSCCYEGFPNVLVQTMVLGKPTICSAIGGLPEIVSNRETGLLFEPNNTKDLVEKISLIYFNPELCYEFGLTARKKAQQEYSCDMYYKRLMKAFIRAVEHKRNKAETSDSVKNRVVYQCNG